MLESGTRVYLTKDIGVVGVPIGMKATIEYVASNSYFFPVHLKLDAPCNDGHCYYRVNYDDFALLPDEEVQEPITVAELDWFDIGKVGDIPI